MFDLSAYVHVPVCEDAVNKDSHFHTFKEDRRFTTILEHTSAENSQQFMNQIIDWYPEYVNKIDWDLVKQNDSIGGAHIIDFPQLSEKIKLKDYKFSPSTVAYTFKALDILNHMRMSKLSNLDILEIGAGYGGQCKIILDLSNLFDIKINSYTLVDLYWPNQLQKKYLTHLGYNKNINFISYEGLKSGDENLNKFNYLISIYALGEFTSEVQQFYIDKMIDFRYHYLVWNTPSPHERFLSSDISIESPKTGPNNVLIKSKVDE